MMPSRNDDTTLVQRARTLYVRYGYQHTARKLNLSGEAMRELLIDNGIDPCPRTHVLLPWVAGEADRPRQIVYRAALREGVLRKTKAPGSTRAGATSVPKEWAESFIAEANRVDALTERRNAGWITGQRVAELFNRSHRTITQAANRTGPLAAYLDNVERYILPRGHAWEPRGIRAALDAYRRDEHEARTALTACSDIPGRDQTHRQTFSYYRETLGVIGCLAPNGTRDELHVKPDDARRLARKMAGRRDIRSPRRKDPTC